MDENLINAWDVAGSRITAGYQRSNIFRNQSTASLVAVLGYSRDPLYKSRILTRIEV